MSILQYSLCVIWTLYAFSGFNNQPREEVSASSAEANPSEVSPARDATSVTSAARIRNASGGGDDQAMRDDRRHAKPLTAADYIKLINIRTGKIA